jgi:hypothetical protein
MRILFLLVFTFFCSKTNIQNTDLAFASYVLRIKSILSQPSTSALEILATNFISKTSSSAVLISTNQTLRFTFTNKIISQKDCKLIINDKEIESEVSISSSGLDLEFRPPSTGWGINVYEENTIRLSKTCILSNSYTPEEFTFKVYIAEKVIYVDSTSGLDANLGTTEAPKQTLVNAVLSASTNCTTACSVAVKGGSYPTSTPILLSSKVSIFGYYNKENWLDRKADKTMNEIYTSTLTDTRTTTCGTLIDPASPIRIFTNTGTFKDTIIDSLYIQSPLCSTTASYTAVVYIKNQTATGSLTIRNSILEDRTSNNNITTYGIKSTTNDGRVDILDNQILTTANTGASVSRYGVIYIDSLTTSTHNIKNNTIVSGNNSSASNNDTVNLISSGAVNIENNQITSGTQTSSNLRASGIAIVSSIVSTVTILNNTIRNVNCSATNCKNTPVYISSFNTNVLVENNTLIAEATPTGTTNTSYGIHIQSNSVTPDNTIIRSNQIQVNGVSNTKVGIYTFCGGPFKLEKNTIIVSTGGIAEVMGIKLDDSGNNPETTSNSISVTGCTAANCNLTGIYSDATTGQSIVKGNTISVGSCGGTTCTTRGIVLDASGHQVIENSIQLGTQTIAGSFREGIRINNTVGPTDLFRNTVLGGSGTGNTTALSIGSIVAAGASIRINSNVFYSGDTSQLNSSSTSLTFQGTVASTIFKLYGNTFVAGNATGGGSTISHGIVLNGNGNFDIRYNLVYCGSANTVRGFHEISNTNYSNFEKNAVHNCAVVYQDFTSGNLSNLCAGGNYGLAGCGTTLSSPLGVGNRLAPFVFQNLTGGNFKLTSGTDPSILTDIQTSDITNMNAFNADLDKEGILRTNSSSLGAYK